MVFISWYSVSEDGKSNSAVLFFYGNSDWKNMYYVESYAARHTQPIRRARTLSRYHSDKEVRTCALD